MEISVDRPATSEKQDSAGGATTGVIVRKATRGDAAALQAVCADYDAVWGFGCPVVTNEDWWRSRIGRTEINGVLAVAEENGRVLGFFEIYVETADWLRRHVGLLGLCVHSQVRGKGLGRLLMEQAVGWSDFWLGLRRLELHVWADHRRAIALYESLGFIREGEHPAYGYRAGQYATALSMARLSSMLRAT